MARTHGRATARRNTSMRASRRLAFWVLMIGLSVVFVGPLVWALSTSFKTTYDADTSASLIPRPFTVEAYLPLLQWDGAAPVLRWFVNSVIVSSVTTIAVVSTASLAAYALARLRFRGRNIVFGAVVGTIFVPGFIFLIPNYLTVDGLGLLDSPLALVLPAIGGAFGVFFLRQFFVGVPKDYEEAALIDGANQFQIFGRIMLPLAQPALSTLAVLTFLASWNDFLWPVYVLFSTDNLTLPAGLPLLQSANLTNYPLIMAGAMLASVPAVVVFVLAQRKIIESVAQSGIKG